MKNTDTVSKVLGDNAAEGNLTPAGTFVHKATTIGNVFDYLIGNYRCKIYYNKKLNFLMRTHIREQIMWRILVMDKKCFGQGSCQMCGCITTALQMANKACDKPCYPKMMSKREWDSFSKARMTKIETSKLGGYYIWSFNYPYKKHIKNGKPV